MFYRGNLLKYFLFGRAVETSARYLSQPQNSGDWFSFLHVGVCAAFSKLSGNKTQRQNREQQDKSKGLSSPVLHTKVKSRQKKRGKLIPKSQQLNA